MAGTGMAVDVRGWSVVLGGRGRPGMPRDAQGWPGGMSRDGRGRPIGWVSYDSFPDGLYACVMQFFDQLLSKNINR